MKVFKSRGTEMPPLLPPLNRVKGAYWIIQQFLVHYHILDPSNIATAIVVALTRS